MINSSEITSKAQSSKEVKLTQLAPKTSKIYNKMSSKSNYYASLKKKLEFAVQSVVEEAAPLNPSSVNDLKRYVT